MQSRRGAIDDLRQAVWSLPRRTRVAMLEGIAANNIIVGAYSNSDGICPMLAAHRAGGRTSYIGFAEAWDRFAQRTAPCRRARRATERELLILRCYLRASLLDDERASGRGAAIAAHPPLLDRRTRPGDARHIAPLEGRHGWAWLRVFRRYDDYVRALELVFSHGEPADDRRTAVLDHEHERVG